MVRIGCCLPSSAKDSHKNYKVSKIQGHITLNLNMKIIYLRNINQMCFLLNATLGTDSFENIEPDVKRPGL